jgi:flagellar motor switch protein FliM
MEKVLNQQEIDAMVRAARGGAAADDAPVVSAWNARQAGQIGRDQLQSINALHEGFARNLTHSVAAYLRTSFTAALVSAEHLTYGELLRRIPEVTYLASFRLQPMGATVVLQLDLSAAFPLIDVLLGGEGSGSLPERQITDIEEQILETVVRIIGRELQTAWQVLAVQFEFEQRLASERVQRVMPPEEKTLSLSFELSIAESRGTLNLVFPAVVSNALLRKISAGWVRERRPPQPDAQQRLRQHLLGCRFAVQLDVHGAGARLRDLMQMVPGSLLRLRYAVAAPAALRAGGQTLFVAQVARRGSSRVAQIAQGRQVADSAEKKG